MQRCLETKRGSSLVGKDRLESVLGHRNRSAHLRTEVYSVISGSNHLRQSGSQQICDTIHFTELWNLQAICEAIHGTAAASARCQHPHFQPSVRSPGL